MKQAPEYRVAKASRGRLPAALVFAALSVCLLLTSGCVHKVTVDKIRQNPKALYGKVVKVEGRVVRTVPLGSWSVYELDDDTGRLWVVARNSGPNDDIFVRAIGRVNAPGNFGGMVLPTHMVEDKRQALRQ